MVAEWDLTDTVWIIVLSSYPCLPTLLFEPLKIGYVKLSNVPANQRSREKKGELIDLYKEGRFNWGATYNQPYEGLSSGEQLVRQAYYT